MTDDEKEDFASVLREFDLRTNDFAIKIIDKTDWIPNGVSHVREDVEVTHIGTNVTMQHGRAKWIVDFREALSEGLYRKFLP
jgi:hypothetical protein